MRQPPTSCSLAGEVGFGREILQASASEADRIASWLIPLAPVSAEWLPVGDARHRVRNECHLSDDRRNIGKAAVDVVEAEFGYVQRRLPHGGDVELTVFRNWRGDW